MRSRIGLIGATLALAVTLAGCHVDEHKSGDNKDVKIDTPFGGMHVTTDNAAVQAEIGLPVYPGATPAPKDNGNDDHSSADVNMSFGNFQLRVKTASYRTPDAPAKVEAFYRQQLKRFGDVIACRDQHPVGTPTQTADGLTCDSSGGNHVIIAGDSSDGKLELKTGSKQHQHIASIEPEGSGTKISLVVVDLPGKMTSDAGGDRE